MNTRTIELTTQKDLMCVAFKPDGVVVGSDGSGAIRLWKVEDGVEVSSSAMKFDGTVYAAVASADGKWIVTSGAGRSVVVWSALTYQRALEVTDHDVQASFVCALDISSDSKLFASGSHDKTVRIFDIASGTRLVAPLYHNAGVFDVRFSPDAGRIATVTHNHSFARVYNTHSGDQLFEIPVGDRYASAIPLAWSTDGQQLFVASRGEIACLDTSTSSRSKWSIHDSSNSQVSIVTSGKLIACSAGLSVSFWDPSSREEINRINHTAPVTCIAISRDGRHLAFGCATGIAIHNLQGVIPERYLQTPDADSSLRLPLMRVGGTVLQSLMAGNLTASEAILSDEIVGSSNLGHEVLAIRSLVRAHLGEWETATEDAEMSLKIKQSPIGQIAKSMGLAGRDQEEAALEEFDLAFHSCDPNDNGLLLVIKSILAFVCNKRKEAISRLHGLINAVGEATEDYYFQVLGTMYLKQGSYEDAVHTLDLVKVPFTPDEQSPLTTICIIFNWSFENLKLIAWTRLCEALYTPRSIKKVGETLQKIVSLLLEDEREATHGHILQEIITHSGEVTLLAWTGKSSSRNSCLPNSPVVYDKTALVLPALGDEELQRRTAKLQTSFPLVDAVATYSCITRLQPVRFTNFRLHLPCIVFPVRKLQKEQENVYRAETAALGSVEFRTTDILPLNEARKLVFVNPWIHLLHDDRGCVTWEGGSSDSNSESNTDDWDATEADTRFVHAPMIEEAPTTPKSDVYTHSLELIARLGQSFSALLLLRQPDGAYRRVAADHEISVRGMGDNVALNIRVEVLEVL